MDPVVDNDVQQKQDGTVPAIGTASEIPFIEDLSLRPACGNFIEKVPIGFARRHRVLGLAHRPGESDARLFVAVCDLSDLTCLQVIARFIGRPVQPVIARPQDLSAAINAAYQQRVGQAQNAIDDIERIERLDRAAVQAEINKLAGREDLLDVADRAPVIKLVNLMLFEAVQARASDVHIQPYEERVVVRLRRDGVLHDWLPLSKNLQEEVVSRVKIMGRMNIAEKRLAQDGRATVHVGDRAVDLRIATIPTSFGERVVVRLLDKSARLYTLGALGMESDTLAHFRELITADHGIVLVTGPTGGGKTTTLYAALGEINSKQLNILTLEDPIEYRLDGISQTQVNEKKGMTFASGLRSVLRQDPDIIMVGEIRDRDTAVMAIQSALTGHLVFSTLHTNDAAGAVARLLDLGIEPYLLASSVIGVLAQRLVRRVCSSCGRAAPDPAAELARLGVDADTIDTTAMRTHVGCAFCRQTGYDGRVGIFELLPVDETIRRQIAACATATQIHTVAAEAGMKSLRDDGVAKIVAGITTVEEVLRVTMRAGL